jgi:ribose 5-phosphate isomerase A
MNAKQLAAEKAAAYLKEGMIIGLGTGSTAAFAINAIGRMAKQGFAVKAVASSLQSAALATESGIEIIPFSQVNTIDLYIDGADEVDRDLNLVKGGGGALLREKILAFNSSQYLVIVDSSKLVDRLGKFPLPVEVTPFAVELTVRHLEKLGCTPRVRSQNGKPFITDNHNLIIDCAFGEITNVAQLNNSINTIPGVVENGLFLNDMVSKVIVGNENGEVNIVDRPDRLD